MAIALVNGDSYAIPVEDLTEMMQTHISLDL